MAQTPKSNFIVIKPYEKTKIVYTEKDALFGLIRWEEIISTKSLGSELRINIEKLPKKIFVNGREVKFIM